MSSFSLEKMSGEKMPPRWHGEVLAAREAAVACGEEKPVAWEEAKKELDKLL